MNSKTYQSTNISRRFPIAVFAIVLMMLPLQAFASHAAGGTCKHKGGLYSLCNPKEGGKSCTRGTQTGKCSQHAKGCTCDLSRAPVLENAITDFRESFDVILASDDLPPSLPAGLASQITQQRR